MNQVEDWAAKRVETLRGCLDAGLRALDLTDDQLAISLDMLSAMGGGKEIARAERHLVVRSPAHAQSAEAIVKRHGVAGLLV